MALPLAALTLAALPATWQEPLEPAPGPDPVVAAAEERRQKTLAAELREDPEFLTRVVFGAAAVLDLAALEPHLAGMLRAGEAPEALRLALRVMPAELARAHAAGVWRPGPEAVRVLLAEIEARGRERESAELLQSLFRAGDENVAWAGRLLLCGGGEVGFAWVADQLEALKGAERLPWLEACGASGRRELVGELGDWLLDERDPHAAATGIVALARLGHEPARLQLDELVAGPADERLAFALEALARALSTRELARVAELALRRDDLAPSTRLALEAGLVEGGAPAARSALRQSLAQRSGAERDLCLRALARAPEAADVEAFAALFPLAGEELLETNVLLAETLLARRHAEGEPFLRAALWRDDWNLCVLAGGLLMQAGGARALLDELEAAPRSVGEPHLRRVGFALGEWGGLGVVEELLRTRNEADPVLQGALLGALSARAAEERARAAAPRIEKPAGPKPGPRKRAPKQEE